MNLYRVKSKESLETYPQTEVEPAEYGYICELVTAESRGEAKWTVWRTCKWFEQDIREMPNFSVRVTRYNIDLPPGVVDNPKPNWWATKKEIVESIKTRKAELRRYREARKDPTNRLLCVQWNSDLYEGKYYWKSPDRASEENGCYLVFDESKGFYRYTQSHFKTGLE